MEVIFSGLLSRGILEKSPSVEKTNWEKCSLIRCVKFGVFLQVGYLTCIRVDGKIKWDYVGFTKKRQPGCIGWKGPDCDENI